MSGPMYLWIIYPPGIFSPESGKSQLQTPDCGNEKPRNQRTTSYRPTLGFTEGTLKINSPPFVGDFSCKFRLRQVNPSNPSNPSSKSALYLPTPRLRSVTSTSPVFPGHSARKPGLKTKSWHFRLFSMSDLPASYHVDHNFPRKNGDSAWFNHEEYGFNRPATMRI